MKTKAGPRLKFWFISRQQWAQFQVSWLNPVRNKQTRPSLAAYCALWDDDRNTLFTGLDFKQPPKLSIIDAETLPIGVKARGTSLYSDIISCVIPIPATRRQRKGTRGQGGNSSQSCMSWVMVSGRARQLALVIGSLPGSGGFNRHDLIAILFATSCALPTDYPWLLALSIVLPWDWVIREERSEPG